MIHSLMKRTLILILLSSLFLTAVAQLNILFEPSTDGFLLTSATTETNIYVSPGDETVVHKAAQMLADDIHAVSGGKTVVLTTDKPKGKSIVVAGTLEHNPLIDRLVKKGRLNVDGIRNGWEQWHIAVVDRPASGIRQALVVVGSDRRGTAYGLLSLSRRIGVSPWTWWADLPAQQHSHVSIGGQETSARPSVKYRGVFINDEDWGLKPWASLNYEKELGDIGPRTYARVCELLLRLRCNMLAPAMHTCTGAFYTHPESKFVADSFAIVITTSHCEPLLLNNADKSEWDGQRDGEWNYATNRETIFGKWDKRLAEAAQFENIYTTAMRGVHDEGLRGNLPMEERVPLLERVIADQRQLLQKHTGRRPEDIQQIFVPYKETMDIYERGLRVPDDVTLVWVDDNYGYMKRVSNEQEQQRSGHAGVYYHVSYLGNPHDYLWLCTTPPVLMYEELTKAYNTGADRYWLLNVGDIKPAELAIQTFADLAWNVEAFDIHNINHNQAASLASIFGTQHEAIFQQMLDTYYRLAWSRKPEFMGWEREWDAPEYTGLRDTEFSFHNYNDAQQRLADYAWLAATADSLQALLPAEMHDAYFELVGFPMHGANEMNRKFLLAQLNHELAAAGDKAGANWAASQAVKSYEAIDRLHRHYDSVAKGKWAHFMALSPAFCSLSHLLPQLTRFDDASERPVDLTPAESRLEGCTVLDLAHPAIIRTTGSGHTLRTLIGIGYDWESLQLGQPTEPVCDPQHIGGPSVDYHFSIDTKPATDSLRIHIYTVPFFPLHKGRELRFGVSLDGGTPVVCNNQFREHSLTWKDQVLQNGHCDCLVFRPERLEGRHTLTFHVGDPGIIIERVVIDWGGLRDSYVGPSTKYKVQSTRYKEPNDQPTVTLFGDDARLGRPFSKDPHVVRFGNHYLMYYTIAPRVDDPTSGWNIGIARSDDLTHWQRIGEIIPAPGCDYERNGLCAPCALVRNDTIHLFYQTYGNRERDAICHAWSVDGLHFTRNATNPIFHPSGDWTCGRAIDAEVCEFKGQYFLYFATRDPSFDIQMQGVATAPLSTHFNREDWTQAADHSILRPELPWEGKCIEGASIAKHDGRLYMFYAGAYNNVPQQIGVAVSDDGIHWQRLSDQPFLRNGNPDDWNACESGHPHLFTDTDGRTYLFYQGNNDQGHTWLLTHREVFWRDRQPFFPPGSVR